MKASEVPNFEIRIQRDRIEQKASQESTAGIQAEMMVLRADANGSDSSGCILKVELIGFANELDTGYGNWNH